MRPQVFRVEKVIMINFKVHSALWIHRSHESRHFGSHRWTHRRINTHSTIRYLESLPTDICRHYSPTVSLSLLHVAVYECRFKKKKVPITCNGGCVSWSRHDLLLFGNIMPLEKPLKATTSNSRKRKSDSSISSSKSGLNKKPRQTLDAFFAPRVSVLSGNSKEKNLVTLNEEQRKVLRLVVDEGKNVFFTGSAGALLIFSLDVAV